MAKIIELLAVYDFMVESEKTMSDKELVIKIDEKLYKNIYSDAEIMICGGMRSGKTLLVTLLRAIRNGTPLPNGHGDLIDKSKICKAIPAEEDNCTGMGMSYDEMDAYNDGIDAMYNLVQNAKIIIEADKEENGEMLICPKCGFDVHSDYKTCPRCGARIEREDEK